MRSLMPFLVLGACLAATRPAWANPPLFKDQAQLFQLDTVRQINQELKEIDDELRQKVTIETYSKVPKSFLTTLLKRKPDFGEWAKKRAGRSGLYVLICTESTPADIHIVARGDLQRAFPPAVCQELSNRLGDALSSGQNDQGLVEAVTWVRQNLTDNFGPPPVFPWAGVFEVLLPILGIWLGILVLRAVLWAQSRSPLQAAAVGAAGSLPVAWFAALANGRLRELFASSPTLPLRLEEGTGGGHSDQDFPEDMASPHAEATKK